MLHPAPLRHLFLLLFLSFLGCFNPSGQPTATVPPPTVPANGWATVEPSDSSAPTARHEAAFVRLGQKAFLLGGRGIKPVDVLDLETMTWSAGSPSPVEIHHFQPVVYNDEIMLLGAMTGGYPGETPLPNIYHYNPAADTWRLGVEIPAERRRGGAGAVTYAGKIYLVCGIVDGHRGGHVPWLDVYDPATNTWTKLPDAPRARDHFQAVIHEDKLYALAGRTTVAATNPFANTIGEVDVFDLKTNTWTTLADTLPTHRAGNAALVLNNEVLVVGGESTAHETAHTEVEALSPATGTWRSLAPLNRGRHGTGVVKYDHHLIMASGCGNRGGTPELADLIRLNLQE